MSEPRDRTAARTRCFVASYIDPALFQQVRELARTQDQSVASLIRAALRDLVTRRDTQDTAAEG